MVERARRGGRRFPAIGPQSSRDLATLNPELASDPNAGVRSWGGTHYRGVS